MILYISVYARIPSTMRHLETLHVLGPTQNCRAILSCRTLEAFGPSWHHMALVASFSTASWDRPVTDDFVPLPSRDASCMLRAAWPIYNVDIESVKQLSSHPLLSSGSWCHLAIFLCPQKGQCQEQRNLVIGLLRLCQILKQTYCRMHFYIFFFLEASFRVWKLWKKCGGLPDSTEEVGSKTSGLLKVSRSRQRTATDQRSVILWRTASHPIAPQWASLFSETFYMIARKIYTIQHLQTPIINVIQRPGVHEYPNHASSVSSLVYQYHIFLSMDGMEVVDRLPPWQVQVRCTEVLQDSTRLKAITRYTTDMDH